MTVINVDAKIWKRVETFGEVRDEEKTLFLATVHPHRQEWHFQLGNVKDVPKANDFVSNAKCMVLIPRMESLLFSARETYHPSPLRSL